MSVPEPPPNDDLNLQTARIPWTDLQRHFARGVVWRVADRGDLVAIASALAADDAERVAIWRSNGTLRPAGDDDARRWHQGATVLWAVVVAPFVLVQEAGDRQSAEKASPRSA